jgi:hypothetical protein
MPMDCFALKYFQVIGIVGDTETTTWISKTGRAGCRSVFFTECKKSPYTIVFATMSMGLKSKGDDSPFLNVD